MRVPLCRWQHRLHRWTSHTMRGVGTVQLVETAMRPRIGVLDLRVAVVLDASESLGLAWCTSIWCDPAAASGDRLESLPSASHQA
jgi:hypothetical protein